MSDFVLCWMLLVTWRLYSRTHPPNGQQNPPQPILASYIWLLHNWDTLPLDNHQPCYCWVAWYSHEHLCMWWRHTQPCFPEYPQTSPNLELVDVIWNFIGRVKRVTFQTQVKWCQTRPVFHISARSTHVRSKLVTCTFQSWWDVNSFRATTTDPKTSSLCRSHCWKISSSLSSACHQK